MAEKITVNIEAILELTEATFTAEQIEELTAIAREALDLDTNSIQTIYNKFGEQVEMLIYPTEKNKYLAVGDGFVAVIRQDQKGFEILSVGPYIDREVQEKYHEKLLSLTPFARGMAPANSFVYNQ